MGDPGFTPSVRDAAGLVALLADDDGIMARDAERALARVGAPVVARVVELAKTGDATTRAGIARLFGRMAGESAALPWLVASLADPDPRVRRAAAHALGKRERDADVEAALLEALRRERSKPEERALVAALGKVGSSTARERLEAMRTDDPELSRILAQARVMLSRERTGTPPETTIADERAPPAPVHVLVRCREGLEDLLREEIALVGAALRVAPRPREAGLVPATLAGPMRSLFALRTMSGFTLELARERASGPADVEHALVRAVTSPLAQALVETFTRGPVRYRIAWGSGGHRRAAVWRCAQAIAARSPAWINDPTKSSWEVVARETGAAVTIELRPRALVDPRFAYRRRDVPAASHPTIAAALVRVAGVREGDVVWDPFVGSGTELVERALAGPYAELYGSDTDARALEAARENFAAADLRGVHLTMADATTYEPPGVTLVLTNPPMGRRVGRNADFGGMLDRFVDHVARLLHPGGRMVWLSPLPARTAEWAKRGGLALHRAVDVDMGGFVAEMQTLVKEPAKEPAP